jgi:hypothetical protein
LTTGNWKAIEDLFDRAVAVIAPALELEEACPP